MNTIPATMRAVLLTGHGELDKLVYASDVPVPEPAVGEVLIEVSACGINNTDIWVRQGAYGTDADPGAVASWRRWTTRLDAHVSAHPGRRHGRPHRGGREGRLGHAHR